MNDLGICQQCHWQPAKFGMYRTIEKEKTWIHVCPDCEIKLGHENLLRARRR